MTGMPSNTRAAFDAAPPEAKRGLERLRALILDVARDAEIPLREETRWGQPAYLATNGSTLRLGIPKAGGAFALYAHCRTSLIADFREATGNAFKTETNRAVLFDTADDIDPAALAPLIRAALTWHQRKHR